MNNNDDVWMLLMVTIGLAHLKYSEDEITSMIVDSTFFYQLKNNPVHVYHYDVDYWVDCIIAEYNSRCD